MDKDAVAALIRDCGDDGVRIAAKGGNNLVGALAKLDDAALERFMEIASKQDREFFKINTEIDEIDFATKVIYEDKNARGLYIENPDVPQTETQWANK